MAETRQTLLRLVAIIVMVSKALISQNNASMFDYKAI